MSRAKALLVLSLLVLAGLPAEAATLRDESARGKRVLKRWSIDGGPRAVAVASDRVIYVGLTEPQSVVAIDPIENRIVRERAIDDPEIASTKDFTSMRIGMRGTRLYIAQGSDESVSILSLPSLEVTREILLEGESIRDALPDPAGSHLYVLGRDVHVFDIEGRRKKKVLSDLEPLAIATDSRGSVLAVVGFEQFPNGRATMVAFYDTTSLNEVGRMPLQTDREIITALYAASDQVLVTIARDWLGEAPARPREEPTARGSSASTEMRLTIDFGDLVSSESICPPDGAGPQIATTDKSGRLVVFAEKRCSSGTSFTASRRKTSSGSIYAIPAYAIARTPDDQFVATDPDGYITIYRRPSKR